MRILGTGRVEVISGLLLFAQAVAPLRQVIIDALAVHRVGAGSVRRCGLIGRRALRADHLAQLSHLLAHIAQNIGNKPAGGLGRCLARRSRRGVRAAGGGFALARVSDRRIQLINAQDQFLCHKLMFTQVGLGHSEALLRELKLPGSVTRAVVPPLLNEGVNLLIPTRCLSLQRP
jgi:hypothetical protein